MTHLDSLQLLLSNERIRLGNAKTEGERKIRKVWVAQLEKEVQGEKDFIASQDIAVDELLAALGV
jgi:hypothetical protein